MIQDVLNIIKYHFNIIFDDQGLDYNRFLTHLRFFMQRLKENKTYASKDSAFIKFYVVNIRMNIIAQKNKELYL